MEPDRSPAVRRVIEAAARVTDDPTDAALAELIAAVCVWPIPEMPQEFLDMPLYPEFPPAGSVCKSLTSQFTTSMDIYS